MRARLPALVVLLVLSLVALRYRSRIQALLYGITPMAYAGVPRELPELPLGTHALDGSEVTLARLRGRVVLLHFWTFACGNCEHMQPSYAAWDAKYRARGLTIVGVHTPELPHERDEQALRDVVKKKAITWTVVPDTDYKVWDTFGVRAWPTILVIGKDGRIVQSFVGDDRAGDIEATLVRLL